MIEQKWRAGCVWAVFLQDSQDDDYIVQFDTTTAAEALVRYVDANNHYRVVFDDSSTLTLETVWRGKRTSVSSQSVSAGATDTIKIKLSGTTIKVWLNGTLKINTTDSTLGAGGFGLSGAAATYLAVKIGYDNNADDDIDDVGDDIVLNDSFASKSTTITYDANGNLTADERFQYEYDAWNRLTKVKTPEDALTIATYAYDALGRRINKVVTNSGDLDGTTYFYYNKRWQMLESRDGSENLDTQVVYGTQYVDEIVRFEKQGKAECD